MVGAVERVLERLNEEQVRYLVVGGVAVVLHGYLRTTADLDLVIDLREENVRRALRALESLGYRPRAPVAASDFADPATRESWVREKGLEVFSLWSDGFPGLEVDLFVREPFDFAAVYSAVDPVQLARTAVRVVPRPLLIDMKRRTGRPRDLEDIAALQALSDDDSEEIDRE